MFLMLLITTLLTAQTISETVVIRKAQGGGGADSLYINGTWYNIPADTITISAVPSANALNSDSLGGFAPATYKDTIFYNGSWIGQNDTLNIIASDIGTTSNINSFTNMQNVTNYVDSLSINFQKENQLEAVATIFAGTGTNALCRSVIAYTYNDTDYIAVANSSSTAGGIRIYNSDFEQVAVVARNGIEFLVYDNVANRIYATTKSNILYSYNYIGGDEQALNYTATTIAEVTNPVIARNTVDSSTVWLYGRESTNLWRAYRITIANATKTIQNTITTDSIVQDFTLDQLVISETRDTIWIANSSGSRNRFLRAIYNAGAVTHTTINVLASSLTGASQSACGAVRIGGDLYVNWQYAFTKHTIGSLSTKTEWGFGSIITENQMFYLSSINRIATLRRAFADNPQQIYLVDLENPYKHSVTPTHASGLVGQDTKNKYIFGAFAYVNAFVIIYKHK